MSLLYRKQLSEYQSKSIDWFLCKVTVVTNDLTIQVFFSLSQIIALFRNRYRSWYSKKMFYKSQNVVINCFKAWKCNCKIPTKEFLLITLQASSLRSCFRKQIFKTILLFCNSSTVECFLVDILYDLTNDFFENILGRLLLSKVYLCSYLFILYTITLIVCYINCLDT